MHEASIAQGIVREVERLISEGSVTGRPKTVRIRVGRLTTVVPDCLDMIFPVVAEGTCLAGARLEIEQVPARAVCRGCSEEFDIREPSFFCPGCSGAEIRIISGSELTIQSVEVT